MYELGNMNSIRGTVYLMKEKIGKEMGTVCSHRHADNLFKSVPSELDISVSLYNINDL